MDQQILDSMRLDWILTTKKVDRTQWDKSGYRDTNKTKSQVYSTDN